MEPIATLDKTATMTGKLLRLTATDSDGLRRALDTLSTTDRPVAFTLTDGEVLVLERYKAEPEDF